MHHPISVLATRPVVAVEADTPVMEALQLMSAQRISRIVVLENSEPIGILTERDVVFTANWVVGQPSLRIREVMSKPVMTASADLTMGEAYQLFLDNDIRHLVVLGSRMEMAGLLTLTDLVRALKSTIFTNVPSVAALMSRTVMRVTPEVTARHALAMMASHAISGVVVVDGKRPIGVFNEHDAIRLVSGGADFSNLPVGLVMTAPVITVLSTDTPARAVDLMQDHSVRRLIVVDDQGDLVGVLTQTDLGRVFEYEEKGLADKGLNVKAGVVPGYGPALH